jgi:hypothetical protein
MNSINNGFVIEEFKPVPRNSLKGFARVRLPSGMIFHDVAVHLSGETWWASPAAKPIAKAGKAEWQQIVTFVSKAKRDFFSAGVIAALRISHPEVFDDERQLKLTYGATMPPGQSSHAATTLAQGVAR